jgi:hypothetical protein
VVTEFFRRTEEWLHPDEVPEKLSNHNNEEMLMRRGENNTV